MGCRISRLRTKRPYTNELLEPHIVEPLELNTDGLQKPDTDEPLEPDTDELQKTDTDEPLESNIDELQNEPLEPNIDELQNEPLEPNIDKLLKPHTEKQAETYTYEPLEKPDETTRVLVLQPGAFDDDIYMYFRERALVAAPQDDIYAPFYRRHQEDKYPDFEALSYCWGSKDNMNNVYVMSKVVGPTTIPVTRNLESALRHLRHVENERVLWIDALCINQKDDEEKSIQVALMSNIYKLANRVIAWLGPEADDSSSAFILMREWAFNVDVDVATHEMRPSEWSYDVSLADKGIRMPYMYHELESITKLMMRPYFERTWIIQEITLPQQVIIQCGQELIPYQDMRNFAMAMTFKRFRTPPYDRHRSSNSNLVWPLAIGRLVTLFNLSNTLFSLRTLRYTVSHTQCEKAQDKIFAVLSLLNEGEQEMGIKVDYKLSAAETFTNVARLYYMRSIFGCELLQQCTLNSRSLDIPSWVPDWSTPIGLGEMPLSTTWSACACIFARPSFLHENVMRVSGVVADRFEEVVQLDDSRTSHKWYRHVGNIPMVQKALNKDKRRFILHFCFALTRNHDFDVDACMKYLEDVWIHKREFDRGEHLPPELSLAIARNNNCMLKSSIHGTIGFGPMGTQEQDIAAVILGLSDPIVLRPVPEKSAWQVVGTCSAHGYMEGEAICQIPPHYRIFTKGEYASLKVLWDSEKNRLVTPATQLTERGFEVRQSSPRPYQPEVTTESLRALEVDVREFDLI